MPRELFTIDPIEKFYRERRTLFIYTDIDDSLALDISQKLMYFDHKSQKEDITILINSPGGEMAAAFTIIDAIEAVKSPVITIGHGLVASAAYLVFITGTHRKLYQRSTVLSHRFSGADIGSQADLAAAHIENERLHQRIINLYQRYSALKSKEEIETYALHESDLYLVPEEVKRMGFCDEICSTKPKHLPVKRSSSLRRWLGAKKAASQRSKKE